MERIPDTIRNDRLDTQLDRAWACADKWPRRESVNSLRRMLASSRARERLLALLIMRRQLHRGKPRAYFGLARGVVLDRNNNCRWQSLIVVGEFIPYAPRSVWDVAVRQADSRSGDMRMAVTVLLLESLLQYDFDAYFQRIVNRIEHGSRFMRSLLPGCWGLTRKQQLTVDRYLRAGQHNNKGLQPAASRVRRSGTAKRGSRSRRLKP